MILRSLVGVFSLCLVLATAWAHGPARGPNGGQVKDLAGHHVELVIRGDEIVLYLFDTNDRPVSAKDAVATATVLVTNKQEIVALQPADDNVMRGRGSFPAESGLKVVVSLTLPGQRPQLGRYTPLN
jgi:hypothetical protein